MTTTLNFRAYQSGRVWSRRTDESASVDLAQDNDLAFWTDHLGCSAEKLLTTVESVGPQVENVTEYLRVGW